MARTAINRILGNELKLFEKMGVSFIESTRYIHFCYSVEFSTCVSSLLKVRDIPPVKFNGALSLFTNGKRSVRGNDPFWYAKKVEGSYGGGSSLM